MTNNKDSRFQDLGGDVHRVVGAKVSPTTGKYLIAERGDPYTCADLGHEDCGRERHEPGTPARDQLAKLIYGGHPDSMYSWDELDSRDKIWPLRTAGAILAAGFSRATVPDAATEEKP